MINNTTPDIQRARSLHRNAVSVLADIPLKAGARFLILNYYNVILDLLMAILSKDGKKIIGKDHHIESIDYLRQKSFSEKDITLLHNLRIIRNDLQYYGTKSESDITDFFSFNKDEIQKCIEKLDRLVGNE